MRKGNPMNLQMKTKYLCNPFLSEWDSDICCFPEKTNPGNQTQMRVRIPENTDIKPSPVANSIKLTPL